MKTAYSITSRDNPKLKLARRIREGKEDGQIFIEGVRLAEEALRSDINITSAFVGPQQVGNLRLLELRQRMLERGVDVYELPDRLLSTLADTENSQGIILTAGRPEGRSTRIEGGLKGEAGEIVVALIRVSNPSNLGAVVRTAEASGAKGVIVSEGSADPFSPKAIRASMGSSLRLPIWPGVPFGEIVAWAEYHGLTATAADIGGGSGYTEVDWQRRRLLVLGSEGHGLEPDQLSTMRELLVIPMENGVESLNLAVSAGIILFEAKRQRS